MEFALVAVVALVVGVVAYLQWQADRRRAQQLANFAVAKGWRYDGDDDSWTARWTRAPFGQGHGRRARNVITGQDGGQPFVAFDYIYKTETRDAKGNRSETTHRYCIVAVALPASLPPLTVSPENLFTRIGGALGMQDIELESDDFNRRFRVQAHDAKFAYDVLHARTMELLLGNGPFAWRVDGAWVVSWTRGRLQAPELVRRLSVVGGVVAGVPSFVWRDAGLPAPPVQPPTAPPGFAGPPPGAGPGAGAGDYYAGHPRPDPTLPPY